MAVGYEEFRSATVEEIHKAALQALDDAGEPYATWETLHGALERIEQMCTESELAYEDGARLEDDVVRERVCVHYDETRVLTWEGA